MFIQLACIRARIHPQAVGLRSHALIHSAKSTLLKHVGKSYINFGSYVTLLHFNCNLL